MKKTSTSDQSTSAKMSENRQDQEPVAIYLNTDEILMNIPTEKTNNTVPLNMNDMDALKCCEILIAENQASFLHEASAILEIWKERLNRLESLVRKYYEKQSGGAHSLEDLLLDTHNDCNELSPIGDTPKNKRKASKLRKEKSQKAALTAPRPKD